MKYYFYQDLTAHSRCLKIDHDWVWQLSGGDQPGVGGLRQRHQRPHRRCEQSQESVEGREGADVGTPLYKRIFRKRLAI